MWPFRRKNKDDQKPKRPRRVVKRLVVGMIIGGAIGSIIGKAGSKDGEDKDDLDDASS